MWGCQLFVVSSARGNLRCSPNVIVGMQRILALILPILLTLASCGSSASVTSATVDDRERGIEDSSDGEPSGPEWDELDAAWQRFASQNAASYSFSYTMQCECYFGPWDVRVQNGALDSFVVEDGDPEADPPFLTVYDVFGQIQAALADGVPVRASYDPITGVPVEFVYNEPALASDGGFILSLELFDPDQNGPERVSMAADLAAARGRWESAGVADYDYVLTVGCFCVSNGPFEVDVRDAAVASIVGPAGESLSEELLAEIAPDVEGMFALVDEALREADVLSVTYDRDLGHVVRATIDYSTNTSDDELDYTSRLQPVSDG